MKHCKYLITAFVLSLSPSLGAQEPVEKEGYRIETKSGKLHLIHPGKKVDLWMDNKMYFDLGGYLPMTSFEGVTITPAGKTVQEPFHTARGFNLAKAYFALKAKLGNDWGFTVEFDVAKKDVRVRELFLSYNLSKSLQLRFGNMKIPVGAGRNISASAMYYYESPVGLSLVPSRQAGLGAFYYKEHYSLSGGLYTTTFAPTRHWPGMIYAVRATLNPIHSEYTTLLVGLNALHHTTPQGTKGIKIATLNDSSLENIDYLPSTFPSRFRSNIGTELAFRHGQLLWSSEFVGSFFHPNKELLEDTSAFAWGLTSTLSYVFKGKARTYRRSNASFMTCPYDGKNVALEGGLRFSHLNVNIPTHQGRKVTTLGLFLNAWMNHNIAFGLQTNYRDLPYQADAGGLLKGLPTQGLDQLMLQGRVLINF